MRKCLCLLSFVLCLAADASHIEETIHLSKGWNAIYLESTPDELSCADFFAGSPVVSVGCYDDSAYESTAQYRSDGTEINQKPVSYAVWFADADDDSSLRTLVGGNCYLIYATNVWEKSFLGVPAQPRQTWRKADAEGDGFMNLVGVSCGGGASGTTRPAEGETTAAAYFGPGPFGAKGTIYQIGGTKASAPSLLSLAFGSKSPTLRNGMAYALTSERADNWPGVIRIGGTDFIGCVDFGTTARRSSFTVANASAVDRTFALTCRPSADTNETSLELSRLVRENPLDEGRWVAITNDTPWTLELRAGESATVQLALDRGGMTNEFCGSVIEVRDESGSQMRVRVPLTASVDAGEDRTTGLWAGAVQLTHVSQWTNETPVAAGGAMKTTLLLHVATNGTATLLPQAVVSSETDASTSNDVVRLRLDLDEVPAAFRGAARRVTGGLVPKAVRGRPWEGTGSTQFDWTVEGDDRVNPFRHAWHPDHGEGIAISNSLQLVRNADWRTGGGGMVPHAYVEALPRLDAGEQSDGMDADGVVSGCVIWNMFLGEKRVVVLGRYALQRFVTVGEIEGK